VWFPRRGQRKWGIGGETLTQPDERATRKERVSVLITAESIIAGFMIAYGALNGSMLIYWSNPRHHGSPITTYIAGMVIYAIVLTCFVSIILLFNSLPTTEGPGTEYDRLLDSRCNVGYDLFLMAILGSVAFVLISGYSIYHYAVTNQTITCLDNVTSLIIPGQVVALPDSLFWVFVAYALFLMGLVPLLMMPKFDRKELRRSFEQNDHRLFIGLLCSWIVIVLLGWVFFRDTLWKQCIGSLHANTVLEGVCFVCLLLGIIAIITWAAPFNRVAASFKKLQRHVQRTPKDMGRLGRMGLLFPSCRLLPNRFLLSLFWQPSCPERTFSNVTTQRRS
jgi:hypothetical protein